MPKENLKLMTYDALRENDLDAESIKKEYGCQPGGHYDLYYEKGTGTVYICSKPQARVTENQKTSYRISRGI